MINPDKIENHQTIKENQLEDISDSVYSNNEQNNDIKNENQEYINDLFSIKNDENNISSIKLNFNIPNNSKIIKSKTNDTNQLINKNNINTINFGHFKALTNASSNTKEKIEYVNKLFDEISEASNYNGPGNTNIKLDNNNLKISKTAEDNDPINEIKQEETLSNKICSLNINYKNENNLFSPSKNNEEKNNNNINKNNNRKEVDNHENDINNDIKNEMKFNNNQDNTNIINTNNNQNNLNNHDKEDNESISIGDIDIDALPKFNNNLKDQTKNSFKIKENIEQNININNIKDNKNIEINDIEKNLNINEHINNLKLGNKIKLKKKKKHGKASKIKEIVNNNDLNEESSNLPLDKTKKSIFDLFPSFSNKNSIKENAKNIKEKKNNKFSYIKKHINENKNENKNQLKRYSNNYQKLFHFESIGPGTNALEKNIFKKENKISETIIKNKISINSNNSNDLEIQNSKFDNGSPDNFSSNNNKEKDINDNKNIINNDSMAKIHENSVINEINYFDFLNQNNLNIEQNNNYNDIFLQNYKRQKILNNSYFSEYIIKEETIFDKIKKLNISDPLPILYQHMDKMKAFDDNRSDFSLLFQYINDKERDNIYQKYSAFQNNEDNYKINIYINDFNNFKTVFEKNEKNKINEDNFEYIRYINELNGDSFYRSFIFNYIELNLINQNLKEISILIIDIFKIYDLESSIFEQENINIKSVLICFSIIYDFIKVNLWEKAYTFFIFSYNNELDQALLVYMKYNMFLYLSKIDFILNVENKNKKKKHHKNHNYNNDSEEFNFDHFNYLLKNYEPKKIIFQSICFIFGISLKIFYYDSENIENFPYMNQILFQDPYNEEENEKNFISLIFLYNSYHICYKKSFINSNGNDPINKSLLDIFLTKKNTISPLSKNFNSLSKFTFCEICNNNCNILEIKNESENNLICDHCLYIQIEEHLTQRSIFLYQEKFKNFLYYLQTISLEILSKNDGVNTFNLSISNYDYINLYNKTFNERLGDIMHNICPKCCKKDNLIKLECYCEMCFNCIRAFIMEKTKNKLILNVYEKTKLEKKKFECPLCLKKLDIDKFYFIIRKNGINLENYYNEAIQRLKNICQKKCLNCLKKISKIEVHKIKKYIKFNIKTFIEGEKLESDLDHCSDIHLICYNCHKMINKNKREIKNEGNIYKRIICNICNIEHYVDIKEWNKFKKTNYCCKCLIF